MEPVEGVQFNSPTVVFAMGRPSPATDRVANAILDFRPGVLIVVATD